MAEEEGNGRTMEMLDRYIKDIETIRHTLESEEDLLLIKPWALVSWGLWTLVGTALSVFLWTKGFTQHRIYLTVWLPVILVGGLFETAAWLSQTKDEAIPLITRRFMRTMISALGVIVSVMVYIWFFLDHPLPLAGPVLMGTGATLLIYCQITFHDTYPEALIVFASGLVFIFGGFTGFGPLLYAGIAPGLLMIEGGIRYMAKGKKRNG